MILEVYFKLLNQIGILNLLLLLQIINNIGFTILKARKKANHLMLENFLQPSTI
jgi:hypothetical protein